MLNQLNSIGIFDNASGRNYIFQKIIESYNCSTPTLVKNGRLLREILIMGPNGGMMMTTLWEGTKLITINFIGGK